MNKKTQKEFDRQYKNEPHPRRRNYEDCSRRPATTKATPPLETQQSDNTSNEESPEATAPSPGPSNSLQNSQQTSQPDEQRRSEIPSTQVTSPGLRPSGARSNASRRHETYPEMPATNKNSNNTIHRKPGDPDGPSGPSEPNEADELDELDNPDRHGSSASFVVTIEGQHQEPDLPTSVYVLVMRWENSVGSITEQYDNVYKVFTEKLKYRVIGRTIPTQNSRREIQRHINEFLGAYEAAPGSLCVIYYIGHGAQGSDGELRLHSRGRRELEFLRQELLRETTKMAQKKWEGDDLNKSINRQEVILNSLRTNIRAYDISLRSVLTLPKHNLALILDCCNAGAALCKLVQPKDGSDQYTYQVLAASRASAKTWGGKFSKTLCEVLEDKRSSGIEKVPLRDVSTAINEILERPTFDREHHTTVVDREMEKGLAICLPLQLKGS